MVALTLGTVQLWAQAPSSQPFRPRTRGNKGSGRRAGNRSGPQSYAQTRNQPVEHSAILPNIGGHGESAAPTVQQGGNPVVAQTECPKPANQMDAPKPQ